MESTTKALVLVGEDDSAQRDILTEVLELEGYRVLTAEDSSSMLRHLQRQPDAVLLDIVGVSNREVMAAVRALPWPPAVLLLSGDSQLPELARRMNADAFLAKPYELDVLLGTLASSLDFRQKRKRVPL
jgi:CheY-like chemotaxis protein